MDVLGSDPSQSRALSNAAFAVMFSTARELLSAGVDVIAEGNFRVGEHDAQLLSLCPEARFVQLLCRAPETQRAARLTARDVDPSRHAGHRDAAQVSGAGKSDDFLDLPGERLLFPSDAGSASAQREILSRLSVLLAAR
jgi:predicted kinase